MTALPNIMVAPNGARRTKEDHPNLPVTIAETVETARTCFEAGAGGIHAHVRDGDQKHVLDAGLYRELIGELNVQLPEMFVQITTEAVGIYSADEQRKLVKDVMPSAVSIGMKEMISDGNLKAARDAYHHANENEISVQHIVYAAEELERLFQLIDQDVIPSGPQQLLFVLGRYTQGQQSQPVMLQPFLDVLAVQNENHDWALCAFGSAETNCLEGAFRAGGKARVGFENSLVGKNGKIAASNEERVAEILDVWNNVRK